MDIREASTLARQLMDQHALSGWSFGFDNARRRFGRCSYRRQLITLSAPLVALNSVERVTDTLLHEIAHAIAGPRAGHGPLWQFAAIKLGARPERCVQATNIVQAPGSYQAQCGTCQVVHHKYRAPKFGRKLHCGRCARVHGMSERTLLNFERTR